MHALFRILHLIFYKYIFIFLLPEKSPSEIHAVKAQSVQCSIKNVRSIQSLIKVRFVQQAREPESPPEIIFVKSPARSGPEKVRPGPPEAREKPGSHSTTLQLSSYETLT